MRESSRGEEKVQPATVVQLHQSGGCTRESCAERYGKAIKLIDFEAFSGLKNFD